MKPSKHLLLGVVAVGIGFAAVLLYRDTPPAEVEAQPAARQARTPAPPAPEPAAVAAPAPAETAAKPAVESTTSAPAPPAAPALAPLKAPATPGGKTPAVPGKPRKQWKDPEARAALVLVGVDSAAEAYWTKAINNADLPANERQDLIEDLNEVGIDPKNLTLDDVPLIMARIAIIDRNLPAAMDTVNADAFAEARKDLVNMLARLK